VGLVSVAVTPYGNEGLFRAVLFAVPWLAILAAGAVKAPSGRSAWVVFAPAVAGLLAAFLIGTFALDGFNVVRRADVTALRRFEAQAPPGSYYLELGDGDSPTAVASSRVPDHYINWQAVLTAKTGLGGPPTPADVVYLASSYERYAHARHASARVALYAFWSPTSQIYLVDNGLMTAAGARSWRNLMRRSPLWTTVYSSAGTYVFRLSRGVQRR
jgi:hypothetical protein